MKSAIVLGKVQDIIIHTTQNLKEIKQHDYLVHNE